jgi:hypothetical protein
MPMMEMEVEATVAEVLVVLAVVETNDHYRLIISAD